MKVSSLAILLLISNIASAETPEQSIGPYQLYATVHQQVVSEIEKHRNSDGTPNYSAPRNWNFQSPEWNPFKDIAKQTAIKLIRVNGLPAEDAVKIATRSVAYDPLLRQSVCDERELTEPKPPAEDLFQPDWGPNPSKGTEFRPVTVTQPQEVSKPNAMEKLLHLPQPYSTCAWSADSVREVKQFMEESIPAAKALAQQLKDPKILSPIEKPSPDATDKVAVDKPSQSPSNPPVASDPKSAGQFTNGISPRFEEVGRGALASTDETPKFEPIGRDTHKGRAPSVDSGISMPEMQGFSPIENAKILRQALDEKVIRREIQPAVADAMMARLAPAIQSESNLSAAFDRVQQELRNDAAQVETVAQDAAQRAKPFSESNSEATSGKTIGLDSLDKKPEDGTTTQLIPGVYGYYPNGSPAIAGNAPITDIDSLAGKAFAKKNALAGTDSPITNLTAYGEAIGGSSTATSGWESPDGEESGDNTTLVTGKRERQTPQTVKAKVASFIDSIAKAFQPKSVSGNALRGIAATEDSGKLDFQDEAALALASVGGADDMMASQATDLSIPIAMFFGAFSLTLMGFAGWQRWRGRRSTLKR